MTTTTPGNLAKGNIITKIVVEGFKPTLAPIKAFSTNISDELGNSGQSATLHLLTRGTAPAIQDVSTNPIDYTPANITSALNFTPVNVVLGRYAPNGTQFTEKDLALSPNKDLVEESTGTLVSQLSNSILTDIFSVITPSNFTNSVSVSAAAFTYAVYNTVLTAAMNLNMPVPTTTFVLDNTRFQQLVSSLPGLPGVNVTDVMWSGQIPGRALGGATVIRSSTLPAGCVGFVCSKEAIAVAARPLPPVTNSRLSYGESGISSDAIAGEDKGCGLPFRWRMNQGNDNPAISYYVDLLYGYSVLNPSALIRLN